MKVKGSVFITLVKALKSDKSGVYDKYLTVQDREVISQKILPSFWYPYETYKHGITAIFEVIAKKNPNVAKAWGRTESQSLMTNMYSAFISSDPLDFINAYEMIHKSFYDFGKIEVFEGGKNQVVFKLTDFDVQCVPIFYMIEGWLECGLELCGAKDIKSEFLTKSWEGHPETTIRFTWL
ncbi:MAG: hypothetical protein A2Y79_04570 [Deltaproteobacteria bacterium RBG_13_43_22]|jgi:hypothetical protein|nr:MAG: hypothetical protein A2Y79_04570 [Deltaproteobacteria bacterium RBG_13_43_22]